MKSNRFHFGRILPTIIILGGIASVSSVSAQTSTWIENGNGSWTTDVHWSAGEPNGPTFNAVIDDGDSAVTITLPVDRIVNDLTLGPDDALQINNNVALTVGGNVNNNGLIQLNSFGNVGALNISGAGNHNLSGSGILRLATFANQIGGSGTLVNTSSHTIEGGGSVGMDSIGIHNLGLIRANVSGLTMSINPSLAGGLTNTGTIRAENGGLAALIGTGGGAFDNTGGTIEALAGSSVLLNGDASVTGGTLTTAGDGVLRVSTTVFLSALTQTGNVSISNNSDLRLSGGIVNSGSITTASFGNPVNIRIESGGVNLSGGGSLNFQGSVTGINGGSTGARLMNVDNVVRGFGDIGKDTAAITNQAAGMIAADVLSQTLVLNPVATATDGNTPFINNGILRASNGGTLLLTGSGGGSFQNNNLIEALDLSTVRFGSSASITGGTLATAGNGVLRIDASTTVFLTGLTQSGNVSISNNSDLRLSGGIVNSGSITTASLGNATNVRIESGGVTLSGGGSLNFQGSLAGINGGSTGARLTNVDNVVRGFGNIGQDTAAITNQAAGIIAADVLSQTLVLNPVVTATDGNPSLINNGIFRASNGGTLLLTGSGGGSFQNNNLIEALDLSTVLLNLGASVTGGTLATSGSGQIVVDANQDVFFTNLSNTGTLIARNFSDLGLSGAIVNSGEVRLTSVGNQTDLEVQAGGVTLTGGGFVTLENNTTGINTDLLGTRLTNEDNTIRGRGLIGQNITAFTNAPSGVIDANSSGGTLVLNPATEVDVIDMGASFINNGILRASSGGILQFTGSGGGNFTNNNQINALDGSVIQLTADARITGGTLTTSGTGVIRGLASQNFDLANLTLNGNLITENNSDLGVTGTINNLGSITITQQGNAADIEVQAGGSTFTGGGSVNFANSIASGLNTNSTGARFTNVDNLLQGTASIGQNTTAITNGTDGLIDANIAGLSIILDPVSIAADAGASFLNDGVLSASNGGTLVFTGSGGGDFTNNGLIEALGGSFVDLTTNAAITGGILSTSDTGLFRILGSQSVYLKNLANEGNIIAQNNSDLGISGLIQNSGSMSLTSAGNPTNLRIQAGGATLQGGGMVTLVNSTTGSNSTSSGSRLTNSDNTIQGRGSFGQNTLAITNGPDATIHANIVGAILLIDPVAIATDAGPSFFNQGVLQASNGGILTITGNGGGDFSNYSAGVLTGGTYEVGAGSAFRFANAAITTNAATIILDGLGSDITNTLNVNALTNFATNQSGASFTLRNNRDLSVGSAFTNNGSLALGKECEFAGADSFTSGAGANLATTISAAPVPGAAQLAVGSSLAVDGTLVVNFDTSSFTPTAGMTWQLAKGSSRSGNFTTVKIRNLPFNLVGTVTYDADSVDITLGNRNGLTYADWVSAYDFATPADALPGADPDGDGMTNEFEFATGTNPLLSDSDSPFAAHFVMVDVSGTPHGALQYGKPIGNQSRLGVTYAVQASTTLAAWSSSGLVLDSTISSGPDGVDILTVRSVDSVAMEPTKLFRLKLDY